MLFGIQSGLMMVATLLIFAAQAWAFIDAVSHRPEAFVAADKMTKPAWMIILGVALAAHVLLGGFLTIVGAVAGIVYMVDARPALRSVTGRR